MGSDLIDFGASICACSCSICVHSAHDQPSVVSLSQKALGQVYAQIPMIFVHQWLPQRSGAHESYGVPYEWKERVERRRDEGEKGEEE